MSDSPPPPKRQTTLARYFCVAEVRQRSASAAETTDETSAECDAPSPPVDRSSAAAVASGSQCQPSGQKPQEECPTACYSNMTVPRSALRTFMEVASSKTALNVIGNCHFVFVEVPVVPGVVPKPLTLTVTGSESANVDRWDSDHVRLPCSPSNLYPVEDVQSGNTILKKRWQMIESALLQPMQSSYDVEEAIVTYNARYENRWDFRLFHELFQEFLPVDQAKEYLTQVIPRVAELAVSLPSVLLQPLPLLKQQKNASVTLSQQQISSLLANAFFCTYPRRNATQKRSEYSSYPSINMSGLFGGALNSRRSAMLNKLYCILHYFKRVTQTTPTGCVTYSRRVVQSPPDWAASRKPLTKLNVSVAGCIEDADGMLQVDFANKFVGGGVLRTGCVQEEIRFIICPELILAALFTECLQDNECLIVHGAERYCMYSGYSDTFKFVGNHDDQTPRDELGRRQTSVVAIDAYRFSGRRNEEFSAESVARELNKAYCGFSVDSSSSSDQLSAVATGNWGCGAFQGDRELKVVIQLMAAAEAGRDVCYFTFGDAKLQAGIEEIYSLLIIAKKSVGDLWRLILQYCSNSVTSEEAAACPAAPAGGSLFSFIKSQLAQEPRPAVSASEETQT